MYLLEFLVKKTIQFSVPLLFWLAAVLIPIALAQVGALDFALIEGRCHRPFLNCGQDHVFQVGSGIAIFGGVLAAAATYVSVMWDDSGWVKERERLRSKHQPEPEAEPTRPDIYN